MNLAQLLVRAARSHPDRVALMLGEQPLRSYSELASRVARLAGFMQQRLSPGDRVALVMTNHPCYLEVMYAAWWAGMAVLPINAKLHPKEIEFILQDAGARMLFVSEDLQQSLQPLFGTLERVLIAGGAEYEAALAVEPVAARHCQPQDLAWLFYTSGTTGRPKGVMLSHRNLYAMTACYFIDVDEVDVQDVVVYAAPMSHGAGIYNLVFMARAARHLLPRSGGFDPAELLQLSLSVGRLCLFAAPTMVKRLVEHVAATGSRCDGFKTIVYGGAPMYVQDMQQALATMGPRFVQIYGQGESPMTITALSRADLADSGHPRWHQRMASVGTVQTMVEVRVVDAEGLDCPVDATGEVLVRGETVMSGYWRNPEASAQTMRGGWLWTGDLGALDAEGYLTLKDRSKDLIISGGSNIYPREVEEVLLRHPDVREVSVVGQADAAWGEVVVAFVVGEGVDAALLDELCLQHIARFKRPKRYRFVAQLPKNNYGKVLKTELREMLKEAEGSD